MNKEQLLKQLKKYFEIDSLPISKSEFKQKYRNACLRFHPDSGGNENDFKDMFNFYNEIIKISKSIRIFLDCDLESENKTQCGTPLIELGLGLGPTINGIQCNNCKGRGYEINYGTSFHVCGVCDLFGFVKKRYPCKSCSGTGKFTQKSGRIVDCYRCNGTGKFIHPTHKIRCPKCMGTKTIYGRSEKKYYVKCYQCNGTGEIEMFNPVLPKGLLKAV